MNIFKGVINITLVILGLLLGIVLLFYGYEKYHLYIFENTSLKISEEELVRNWGQPDKEYRYDVGSKTVFYNTFFNEFVFNINTESKVDLKYKDNF
jgi:predicted membrane protein